MIYLKYFFLLLTILQFISSGTTAQPRLLEAFEDTTGWVIYASEGVMIQISNAEGVNGKCIRLDYNFTKGSGYGGIQKMIPVKYPDNYRFSFLLRGDSPGNNFEFKLADKSGDNVWWVNKRNYEFPKDWKKISYKKRHIGFAWGPAENKTLIATERLEFTIASFSGGKGTIYLDELTFEELTFDKTPKSTPSAELQGISPDKWEGKPGFLIDSDKNTSVVYRSSGQTSVKIDLGGITESGGLVIDWGKNLIPRSVIVSVSEDDKDYNVCYSADNIRYEKSWIPVPDAEFRFIMLQIESDKGTEIKEVSVKEPDFSINDNRFFINVARESRTGLFPRYFSEQKTYWTVTGVSGDKKESLINEDGLFETDKMTFSLEPFLYTDGKLITRNDVKITQGLEDDYIPVPHVKWDYQGLELKTTVFADGEANKNSVLYGLFELVNNSDQIRQGKFLTAIRPFQANPHYQELNMTGGVAKLKSISKEKGYISADSKKIFTSEEFGKFGATKFSSKDIAFWFEQGDLPEEQSVQDDYGYVSAGLESEFELKPGESLTLSAAIPFYGEYPSGLENLRSSEVVKKLQVVNEFWRKTLNHITYNLPPDADQLINTVRSNTGYILINRDKAGIQPGSRSYERSWIRDGSLTSAALLKMGLTGEIKEFINWYSSYQYENGKVPCVVDSRGADPVPEHDSHGELIYLIKQYFNFTGDTLLLRERFGNVSGAVSYIKSLVAERSNDHFKYGNDSVRAYYGILPESISHEGYSDKPMHSYWDNFFAMKGLKDAADIAVITGDKAKAAEFTAFRDEFRKNLYNSLDLAVKTRKIDYIPGCVEKGDFDATSTTIAIYPCNELKNMPKQLTLNTFDKYFQFTEDRRNGKLDWMNYTPYEVRTIGSFIFLDQPERAHRLIDFFMKDQRPQGWNHWAEVVWKDYRLPRFIGDMPHTWVGSDFINAARTMFIYENELENSLVIGAGLKKSWTDFEKGISVENLPTYYGDISYKIKKTTENTYMVEVTGKGKVPPGGFEIRNLNNSKLPASVTVNGKKSEEYSENKIRFNTLPAILEIKY